MSEIPLTDIEKVAIATLKALAKWWPKSLLIFGGSGCLTVRKPAPGKFYDDSYTVARIEGIPCDGGDGGTEFDSG